MHAGHRAYQPGAAFAQSLRGGNGRSSGGGAVAVASPRGRRRATTPGSGGRSSSARSRVPLRSRGSRSATAAVPTSSSSAAAAATTPPLATPTPAKARRSGGSASVLAGTTPSPPQHRHRGSPQRAGRDHLSDNHAQASHAAVLSDLSRRGLVLVLSPAELLELVAQSVISYASAAALAKVLAANGRVVTATALDAAQGTKWEQSHAGSFAKQSRARTHKGSSHSRAAKVGPGSGGGSGSSSSSGAGAGAGAGVGNGVGGQGTNGRTRALSSPIITLGAQDGRRGDDYSGAGGGGDDTASVGGHSVGSHGVLLMESPDQPPQRRRSTFRSPQLRAMEARLLAAEAEDGSVEQ